MRLAKPNPRQVAARDALLEALRPFDDLPQIEICSILAYTLGQVVALQNQTKHTANEIMDLVAANIQQGNQDAVAHFVGKTKGNA